jgi:hypothetical protein
MAAAAPFAMKALPFIAKGAGALGSMLFGKKIAGPSKEQQGAMTGAQQSVDALGNYAGPLVAQGSQMARQGGGDLSAASRYYSGVLGSRGQARETMAPEINTIMDFYRGSEAKTRRTMRGGARDNALAELDRQKVGQTASLIPEARRNAAEGLMNTAGIGMSGGSAMAGVGVGAASNAAHAATQLFNMSSQQRQEQNQTGQGIGNFIYDILGSSKLGGLGQSKGPQPFPGGLGGPEAARVLMRGPQTGAMTPQNTGVLSGTGLGTGGGQGFGGRYPGTPPYVEDRNHPYYAGRR